MRADRGRPCGRQVSQRMMAVDLAPRLLHSLPDPFTAAAPSLFSSAATSSTPGSAGSSGLDFLQVGIHRCPA